MTPALAALGIPARHRWGGFKALRQRWTARLEGALLRPVLLIDEAQEMHPTVLNELRLLTSTEFDSRSLLSVILAGDARLLHKLGHDELLPPGSRIRTRLAMEYADRKALMACLQHLTQCAGNARLMTPELMRALCDHAVGNFRVLTTLAAELLTAVTERELTVLDEKLYLEVGHIGHPKVELHENIAGKHRLDDRNPLTAEVPPNANSRIDTTKILPKKILPRDAFFAGFRVNNVPLFHSRPFYRAPRIGDQFP